MQVNNAVSFEAKIIENPKKLIWNGVNRSLKAEAAMENVLEKIETSKIFKKVAKKTPDDIVVETRVSNFSPSAYKLGVSKVTDDEYSYHALVDPINIEKGSVDKLINNIVKTIKELAKRK